MITTQLKIVNLSLGFGFMNLPYYRDDKAWPFPCRQVLSLLFLHRQESLEFQQPLSSSYHVMALAMLYFAMTGYITTNCYVIDNYAVLIHPEYRSITWCRTEIQYSEKKTILVKKFYIHQILFQTQAFYTPERTGFIYLLRIYHFLAYSILF